MLTYVGSNMLTKASGIWLYLADLQRRGVIQRDPLDSDNWELLSNADGRWKFSASGSIAHGDGSAQVEVIAVLTGRTSPEQLNRFAGANANAWQAYLTQKVVMPDGTVLVLLDTSDYSRAPISGLYRSLQWASGKLGCINFNGLLPGDCGQVSVNQIRNILDMLTKQELASDRLIFVGHHPWMSFGKKQRDMLLSSFPELQQRPYISAHIHNPASIVQGGKTQHPWELNVGSTTDYPMEHARLKLDDAGDVALQAYRFAPFNPDAVEHCALPLRFPDAYPVSDNDYHWMMRDIYASLMGILKDHPSWLDGVPLDELKCSAGPATCAQAWQEKLRKPLDRYLARNPIGTAFPRLHKSIRYRSAAQPPYELLRQLVKFDRERLGGVTQIRDIQRTCAIWGAVEEFRRNGFFASDPASRGLESQANGN